VPDPDDLQASIDRTRADLAATLNEIEDKLNVPKQLGIASSRAKESYDRDPVPWIAAAGVAALAVVGIVVAVVRSR